MGSSLVLMACGSSTSDPGTPSGPASGSTCDPVTFATLNTAGSNAKVCAAMIQCVGDRCSASAKECAGPDWTTGVFAGKCGSYYDCVKTCKCVKACVDKCDVPSVDCAECLSYKLGYGCTMPCAPELMSCGT
jgi:hypothetical protein